MDKRPIRLTFTGEVESYNPTSRQWIKDLSRDPREFIPLSMPPAVPESLTSLKATCANSIAHQLKATLSRMIANAGDTSEPEPNNWNQTWYEISAFGQRYGFDLYNTDGFGFNLGFLITGQLFQVDLSGFPADDTFWDKVVCHAWCFMSDDCTFSYVNWQEMIQAIRDDVSLGDGQEWLRLMIVLIGRKGLTNLGYLKINDTDVLDPGTDCECA